MATHPEPLPPIAKKSKAVPRPPWGRTANWIAAVTTVVLLGGSVGGYYYDRKQREALAAPYLRLVVTGPAALEAAAAAQYSIATSTISGEPLPSSIEWSLRSADGKRLIDRKEADESGSLRVTVPADMALPSGVELDVTAAHGGQHEDAKALLAVEGPQDVVQLTLDRPGYRRGETVYYRALALSRRGLLADRAVPIHFEVLDPSGAVAPGSPLEGLTDRGVGQGVFVVGEEAPEGKYTLVARSMDGGFAEQRRCFFIGRRPGLPHAAAKELAVAFYPEGGAVVEGLENRVYFTARDALGQLATIKGLVVDGRGRGVADAETVREGMGWFSFLPGEGQSYRLKVSSAEGMGQEFSLPAVSGGGKIVLDAGTGVFAADAPLEFNIRAAKEGIALVVAASCRGGPCGEQTLVATLRDHGANPVAIPLDEQAAGVIRLTAYDYSGSPPQVVARRLVYRRPSRWLTVRAAKPPQRFSPGGKVSLTMIVADETGHPAPATLGISVVDCRMLGQAELEGAGWAPGTVPYLWPFVTATGTVPDLFHADDKDATVAMDLLLGTQKDLPATDAAPPLMIDNLAALQTHYERSLAEYQQTRTRALDPLVALCFFGGLGLLLLVTMLALMNVVSGRFLWLPTMVAAACCALIGLNLMDPGQARIERRVTPFAASAANPPADSGARPAAAKEAAPKTPKTFAPGRYEYRRGGGPPAPHGAAAETLYWNPLAIAGPDGRVEIAFDLPAGVAAFAVLVDAHGDGRVGAGRTVIKADDHAAHGARGRKAEGNGKKAE
jgi:hypothetical protein